MVEHTNEVQATEVDARSALLTAATRLFASQGYSATGVQQITDAANVNKAMLYYYFGSKEQLYAALIAEGITSIEGAVAQAMQPGLSLEERLRAFLTHYLAQVAHHPELARIIYREIVGAGEHTRQTVIDHFSESIHQLAAILSEAQHQHELREIDATLSAYTLIGMANIFISSFFVTGRCLDLSPTIEHIVDLFLHGAGRQALA